MIKFVLPLLLATAGTAGAQGLATPLRSVPITRSPVMVFPDQGYPARFPSVSVPLARIPTPLTPIPSVPFPMHPVIAASARTIAVPIAYLSPAVPLPTLPAAKARFASANGKGLELKSLNAAFDKTAEPEPEPVATSLREDSHQTLPEQDLEREIGLP